MATYIKKIAMIIVVIAVLFDTAVTAYFLATPTEVRWEEETVINEYKLVDYSTATDHNGTVVVFIVEESENGGEATITSSELPDRKGILFLDQYLLVEETVVRTTVEKYPWGTREIGKDVVAVSYTILQPSN